MWALITLSEMKDMMTYLILISQGCIEIYTAIIPIKGISSMSVKSVVVVEPLDVLRLGISAWNYAKRQGLFLVPGEMLVSFL